MPSGSIKFTIFNNTFLLQSRYPLTTKTLQINVFNLLKINHITLTQVKGIQINMKTYTRSYMLVN